MSPEEVAELQAQGAAEEAELSELREAGFGGAAEEDDEGSDGFEDDDEEGTGEDGMDEHGLPPELRMDEYDEEEAFEGQGGGTAGDLIGIEDDEGSDAEENVVEATDMVMLAARTDDDSSVLEMHCYGRT